MGAHKRPPDTYVAYAAGAIGTNANSTDEASSEFGDVVSEDCGVSYLFVFWTRRSLFGPDGISLRGSLEAGGP